jgi:hypothetical protein
VGAKDEEEEEVEEEEGEEEEEEEEAEEEEGVKAGEENRSRRYFPNQVEDQSTKAKLRAR